MLKSIYDPEIPVDIYELGLIYDVDVSEDGDATITMTLTTPHCPVAESMPGEVELRVLSVPGIRDAVVNLVWDPPWDPSKMSDEAQARIGNAVSEPNEQGNKLRARPAAITLTPAAEARIAELMSRAPEGAVGVKLSTPRRGCSGLAYSVDYVTEEQPFDEKIETPGGAFYVDGASVLYLVGSTMDWREDDFAAGFVFDNPNAKGACGCGESFTVWPKNGKSAGEGRSSMLLLGIAIVRCVGLRPPARDMPV